MKSLNNISIGFVWIIMKHFIIMFYNHISDKGQVGEKLILS